MPTFYRPANRRHDLGSVVWNPKANAVLADFSRGNLFETNDSAVIQRLQELGYPTVEEYEDNKHRPQHSPPAPQPPHELKPQPPVTREPQQREVKAPPIPPKAKAPVIVKKGAAVKLKKRPAPSPDSMDADVSPSER